MVFIVLCAFLSFLHLSSCAGIDTASTLETKIADRRAAGEAETARRIASIVSSENWLDIRSPDQRLAAHASRGELRIAIASWWGWDSASASEALDTALQAPVDILIVPRMESPWIVDPLTITGPKTVFFEPGSALIAKKGAFKGKDDCLITIRDQKGINLIGYGAALRMLKDDYLHPPYEESQWRHAVSIIGSHEVSISGFTIEDAGGDGIYIGQKAGESVPSEIELIDLTIMNSYRQGISVISAAGFTLSSSVVMKTSGHSPQAGIDFEPNSSVFGFERCVVSECIFRENAGAAVHIHLSKIGKSHSSIAIAIENSVLAGSPIAVWMSGLENGAAGLVTFRRNAIGGLKFLRRSESLTTVVE